MTSLPPVRVEGVGKRYVKFDDEAMLASRRARLRHRTTKGSHWALRNVNVEVSAGECLGIIGRNGSGKTTLLRMLAGVTAPTEGRVTVLGRVAPLIAVGVGFHPELTGRENIFVNGAILGVSRRVIQRRLDEIIEFAGVETFIDTPVKFYSSGMFVRLGFGVSMFVEPKVLLVDEVLAVGDLGFQLKCFDRMAQVRNEGTAVVVVSHNLNAIRLLCRDTMLLDDGIVRHLGPTADAISLFHKVLDEERDPETATALRPDPEYDGDGPMFVDADDVDLLRPDGSSTRHVRSSDDVSFVLRATPTAPLSDPIVALRIYNEAGLEVYGDSTLGSSTGYFASGTRTCFTVRMRAALASGSYAAIFEVSTSEGVHCMRPTAPLSFFVEGRRTVWGAADLGAQFDSSPA